jgi:hypothetical protein
VLSSKPTLLDGWECPIYYSPKNLGALQRLLMVSNHRHLKVAPRTVELMMSEGGYLRVRTGAPFRGHLLPPWWFKLGVPVVSYTVCGSGAWATLCGVCQVVKLKPRLGVA